MFDSILAQFATLVGFSALVSVIINVLKLVGVVKDGTADKWIAGFNLIGIVALTAVKIFAPDFNVGELDATLAAFANVAAYVVSYIAMLLGSKLTYLATRGLPFIGKSNSNTPPVG